MKRLLNIVGNRYNVNLYLVVKLNFPKVSSKHEIKKWICIIKLLEVIKFE